jgi:hypothetical protein
VSVIHAYLEKSSDPYSYERLAAELASYFDNETKNGMTIGSSANPFTKKKYAIFRWPGWSFSAHFEAGENVTKDAEYVLNTIKSCPPTFKDRTERIRLVFSADESRDFTNHIIWAIEYLEAIPGAILFDETQKDIVSLRNKPKA